MKRVIILLFLGVLFLPAAQAGPVDSLSSESCISSTGGQTTISFVNPAIASSAVTIKFYYRGDLNGTSSNTERFYFQDENGNSLDTSEYQNTQCDPNQDSVSVTVPASTFNSWVSDGTVDFVADADATVSASLAGCSAWGGSCAQVRLNYQSVTGPDDAGVSKVIVGDTECPDSLEVKAVINNYGTNQLDSVDVSWTLNSTLQATITYTQLLDTLNGSGPSSDTVSFGNHFFTSGTFQIEASTSNPNGNSDNSTVNDAATLVKKPVSTFSVSTINSVQVGSDSVAIYLSDTAMHEVQIGQCGFTLGQGAIVSGSDTIQVQNLSPNTCYEFYVRKNCPNGFTNWGGPVSFKTPCSLSPITLPMNDGFENYTGPDTTDGAFFCGAGYGWSIERPAGNGEIVYSYSSPTPNFNRGSQAAGMSSLGNAGPIYMILTVDMSNYVNTGSGVSLSYFLARYDGFSSNVNNRVWIRGSRADSWIEVLNWDNLTDGTFVKDSVTLDQVLRANGQNFSSSTQVRFGQQDFGNLNDGLGVDDVIIEEVPCPAPSLLGVKSVADTGGTLNWSAASNADSFQVWIGSQGFYQGTQTTTGSKTNFQGVDSLVVDTLSPQTCYEFLVRSKCSNSGDTTQWIGPFSFCTPCSPISAPYIENWDGLSAGADLGCFSPLQSQAIANDNFDGLFITGSSFDDPRSSPNQLEINAGGDPHPLMAVSPPTSDMMAGDKRLRFYPHTSSGISDLVVGTMSDPNDASTFHTIDTLAINALINPYTEYIVNFTAANGYNGTDSYFAFASANPGGFPPTIFIDDVHYETIPSCVKPTNVNLTTADSNSATVEWIGSNSIGNTYEIEYGTGTLGASGNSQTVVNTDSATVTGLMSGTDYCTWVREICSAGDTSAWKRGPCFKTTCLSISAPYTQNWDALSSGKDLGCFLPIQTPFMEQDDFDGLFITTTSVDNPISSPAQLEISSGGDPNSLIAVSPPTTDLTAGDKRVRFYAHTGFGNEDLIVGTTSNPYDSSAFNPVDTITPGEFTTSIDFVVNLDAANGYNGTDQHFAFAHGDPTDFSTIFIDNVIYETIPTCKRPTNVAVSRVDTNSAQLSWNGSNSIGNTYQIEYGTGALGSSANMRDTVSADSTVITGLTPDTEYCAWVREICAAGDTSIWRPIPCFTTLCLSIKAPYFQNWDALSSGNDIGCFRGIQPAPFLQSTFDGLVITTSTFDDPVSSPAQLEIAAGGENSPLIAVSPITQDLTAGDKRLRFYAHTGFGTEDLIVGTMSDHRNATTFNAIDTINVSGTAPGPERIVKLDSANGYNGTDQFFALRHGDPADFSSIFIDNLNYETIPDCVPRPSNFANYSKGSTSLSFTWTGDTTTAGSDYVLQYSTTGTLNDSGNVIVPSGNDSATISGLMSNTNYCVWVAEVCAPGDTSIWEGPICLNTACVPFSVPYSENFDAGGWVADDVDFSATNSVIDPCWSRTPDNGVDYSWRVRSVSTGSGSTGPNADFTGGNFVYTEASNGSSGDSTSLASPTISLAGTTNPQLKYKYFFFGSNIDKMDVEVNAGSGWSVLATISGQQQTSASDPWLSDTVDLTAYAGDSIQVRFKSFSLGCCGGDMAIDDIFIGEAPTCPAPGNFSASATSSSSATVSWDTTGVGASSYIVEYGPVGFTPGSGTTVTSSSDSVNITGLTTQNLCQEAYLQAICGAGDSSTVVGPISVCPEEVICTENFDQYSTGAVTPQSALIVPWQNGTSGDDSISTVQAESGTQSMRITDQGPSSITDVVAYFDTISSGVWRVSWDMYVPTGDAAYYNIQQNHALSGGTNLWLVEVTFDASGTVTNNINSGTFSYPQGQWFEMSTVLDIGNDSAWFEVDSNYTGVNFVMSATNGLPLQFNGVDFFADATAQAGNYFVDNFCVQQVGSCPNPTNISATSQACDSLQVNWNSNSGSSYVLYGPTGFTPGGGNGTSTGIVSSPYDIGSLQAGTGYDVYVADTCGVDSSNLVGPQTVTTNSGPLPTASFTKSTSITGGIFQVNVDASASANADTFRWSYGGGANGMGMLDTTTYVKADSGMQAVTLIVSNACGSDTARDSVKVNIGLAENPLAQSLQVYPNPTNDQVTVSFEAEGDNEVALRLTDMQGRAIRMINDDRQSKAYERSIDVSDLADGVYILEISSGDLKARRRITVR